MERKIRHEPRQCENCKNTFDAATGVMGPATPQVGDVSICSKCGHLMEFDSNLNLVSASQEVKDDAMRDPIVSTAIKTIKLLAAQRKAASN